MVAINYDVDESVSLELAEPLDSVGKLEIITDESLVSPTVVTGTATLVAPNKILTAAHVLDADLDGITDVEALSQYSFLVGDNLAEGADLNVTIESVSLHPSWVAAEENRLTTVGGETLASAKFDVAVLTLSEEVTDLVPIQVSPEVASLADSDNQVLLGETATIVGYGKFGSINATLPNQGERRAAKNIIDSVDNNIIRFDYDSTFLHQQDGDEGLNAPSLDGSSPELIPVPTSSPIPIDLEGGIGEGDSGGPLLIDSEEGLVTVGVASEFIDTEVIGDISLSGYGSVYVYSPLNNPETVQFLEAENVIDNSSLEQEEDEVPVYKFLRTDTQTQFYTTSETERDVIRATLPQYELEGLSFVGVTPPTAEEDITGLTPVYRFFNQDTGIHLYTADENEKNFVEENLDNFVFEGTPYYAFETQQEGTIPLYRFYNQELDAHFYTPSAEERDTFMASADFEPEGSDDGIAFYVEPSPEL